MQGSVLLPHYRTLTLEVRPGRPGFCRDDIKVLCDKVTASVQGLLKDSCNYVSLWSDLGSVRSVSHRLWRGLLQLQRLIKYGCNFSLVRQACLRIYCINLMFCLKYQWPWCPAYWPRCPLIIFKSQGQLALPSICPNSRPVPVF